MKTILSKHFIAMLLVLAASLSASRAITLPMNITVTNGVQVIAAPKSTIANYGDSTVYDWIAADVLAYNALTSSSLPTSINTIFNTKVDSGFGSGAENILLGGGTYLFLHWGGQGGGWHQVFYIEGLTGTFNFTQPPGGNPAVGGLSFYSIYGANNVPDGGSTALLLGGALAGLGMIRRKLSL